MPFTLAHPAAVLPLLCDPVSISMKNLGHIAVRTISSILLALFLACVLTMALKKSGRAS